MYNIGDGKVKHIYTSIDIGSDTIKIVVCELFQNRLNLLAASSVKAKGIKKGLVTDVYLASESLKEGLEEVETMLGIKIKRAIVTVPSYETSYMMIEGKTEIATGIVTGEDVNDVLSVAFKSKDINDKEMITIVPIEFSVDSMGGIKDPKGKNGKILSVKAIEVLAPKKVVYSVISLFDNIGLEIVDISIGGIGDMQTYKTKEISHEVGAIVNIGYEVSNISIYNKGIIIKNSIIGLGGKNIDNDISYIFKLLNKDSTYIKERFAVAHSDFASANDFYTIKDKDGEIRKISQLEVSKVVMSRIEDILSVVKKEINSLTKRQVDYIIITGGTSSLSHFQNVAENVFGNVAKCDSIKILGVRNNKYSSVVGNIIYFINKLRLKGLDYTMLDEEDIEMLAANKKGLLGLPNDSMLGKVFGYFFDE